MMKSKFEGKSIFNIALLLLSVGMLVYFCISNNNLVTLINSLPSLNLFWLLIAVLAMAFNWFMDSQILLTIISAAYKGRYSFKSAFKVTMVGQYFNSITPYSLGGQPMQFIALTRQGLTSGIAISTLVTKFLVYQTTISLYSLLVIILRFQFFESRIFGFMPLAVIGFLSQAATVLLLVLFSRNRKLTEKIIHGVVWLLSKLHIVKKPEEAKQKVQEQLSFYLENNKALQHNRSLSLRLHGLTAIQLTSLFSIPFFLYKAFHNPGAPIIDMISAQSFVTMISSYTPLPGAAGAAEGSFLMLFQMFFTSEVISQAMLLWRFIAYYSCILVGAPFAGLSHKADKMAYGEAAKQVISPFGAQREVSGHE